MFNNPGQFNTESDRQGGSLIGNAKTVLNGFTPDYFWDFMNNRAIYTGVDIGAVTSTPGWTVAGGSLNMTLGTGLVATTQTYSATIPTLTAPYTLYAQFIRGTDSGASEFYLQTFLDSNNRANLQITSADVLRANNTSGGAATNVILANPLAAGATVRKASMRVQLNNLNGAVGGVAGTANTSVSVPTSPTSIQFLSNNGANFAGSGNILRYAAIFVGTGMSDANQVTLTT